MYIYQYMLQGVLSLLTEPAEQASVDRPPGELPSAALRLEGRAETEPRVVPATDPKYGEGGRAIERTHPYPGLPKALN